MLEGIEGVSTFAEDVARANMVIYGISIFLFVVTIGTMFYLLYKYNAKKHKPEDTENIKHHTGLEITWTVVPTILLMICFYYGIDALRAQRTIPDNGIEIKVIGKKWSWIFEYENGKKTSELYVPVNENVILKMTAPLNDVTHSFYVPAFRTKEDVVPGRITTLWFNSMSKGSFDIECAEYCGTGHSFMLSKVNVIDKKEYEEWQASEASKPGEKIVKHKGLVALETNGCISCHSLNGTKIVGPALNDIAGKDVTLLDGKVVKRDKTYLIDAIKTPNKEIVKGYAPIMPAGDGLSSDEIDNIIDYLENGDKRKIDAMGLLSMNGCLGCHSTNGTKMVGPSFKGIWNRKVKLENGKEVNSDKDYLIRAINEPNIEIVSGFTKGVMPSSKNSLSKDELEAIIALFKKGF